MVEPTKGIGQIPGIANREARDVVRQEKSEEKRGVSRSDEVEISEEAQSLQEAEKSAKQAREALEKDESLTLGLDPEFDEAV